MIKADKKIIFGFSERRDGQMKVLGNPGRMIKAALANRKKYFSALGLDPQNAVSAGQEHGRLIKRVGKKDIGQIVPSCDGLFTLEPDVILTITGADCLPIIMYDRQCEVAGIVHAGWQGVLKNAAGVLAGKLLTREGIKSETIRVFIGPHIRANDFEVSADLARRFERYPDAVIIKNGRYFVDLSQVVKCQLSEIGISKENIILSRESTVRNPQKYFSFRRDKPKHVEAMISFVMLKHKR